MRETNSLFYNLSSLNAHSNELRGIQIGLRDLLLLQIMKILKILPLKGIPQINTRTYAFTDYFKGFNKSKTVRKIFGERTEEILLNLKVQFTGLGGYMWVSPEDGHIIVNSRYVNNADRLDIYLDIIHELVHVRQFMEGKDLFDANYGYVERPTEIEAYFYAVEEARSMGISDRRILQYLEVEWLSDSELKQLATTLNIATDQSS